VLLIGVDETQAMTIFEGNHRLSAGMLIGPHTLSSRFRAMCGFSAHMRECCWYETNLANLWRYLKHRITHIYDREADVERLLLLAASAQTQVRTRAAQVVGDNRS
jgi:hypothetical protein